MNKHNFALITGSSKGLGFAIARDFDRKGISTILTGRSKTQVDNALNQLSSTSHRAFSVDFSNDIELKNFLSQLIENQIIPNILIHNLGGRVEGDNFPLDFTILNTSMQMNLEVALKINEIFLPYMVDKKFGRIIHISSDASLTGQASPAYVIAKSALNGYVKSAARHYAKHNIMICAVLPGIIEHEGSAWALKKMNQPDHYQNKLAQMPAGRFGQPDDIAGFVTELATSQSIMSAGGLYELCGAAR